MRGGEGKGMRRAAETVFRLLMLVHPRGFRARYGAELMACFRDAWGEEVAGRGPGAACRFWARTVAGALGTAFRQRIARAGRARGGRGVERMMILDSVRRDLRLALRGLRRRPGWAMIVILTLGLGMGATTAVFSVLNGVLLAPLPYGGGDRLARVYLHNAVNGSDGLYLSAPAAAELRDETHSLDAVAILQNHNAEGATLMEGGAPKRVRILHVNAEYFDVLGVLPYLGRPFARAEENPDARVAVVTQQIWEQELGADDSSLGRSVMLDGEPYTVIGVVPGAPRDPLSGPIDVWLPADLVGAAGRTWENNYLSGVARLAEDVSLSQARAELAILATRHATMGEAAAEKGYTVLSLKDDLVGDVRPLLGALMGAVGFLFLLTLTNVASLFLARTATREDEFAIRSALGSRRRHLLTQSFVETAVVALAGGAAGLALGTVALDGLLALAPLDLPLREAVAIGRAPVVFAAGLAVAAAVALGLVVSLPYVVRNPGRPLGEASRAGQGGILARRTRDALVVFDVAFAVILLVGAGVLFRTVDALRSQELGVDPEGVVAFQVDLPELGYASPGSRIRFQDDLLGRLASLPGVEVAGSVSHLPVTGSHNTWGTRPASASGQAADMDNIRVNQRVVDGAYFEAVGIRLLAGRTLGEVDRAADIPSVVVNRRAAETLFGDQDPVGRRLAVGPLRPVIVGVVEDVALGARLGPAPTVYHAYDQFGAGRRWTQYHVLRTSPGEAAPWPAIRSVLDEVDPGLVTHGMVRLNDVVGADIAEERFAALLLRAFAALGVLLAALGLFGVLAHSVQRRKHEIGVRIALGAAASDVRGRVLRRGLGLSLVGTGLGLAAAYALSRGLEVLVFGVSARDPVVFVGTPVILIVVAVASCWIPARNAVTVDALQLLRSE